MENGNNIKIYEVKEFSNDILESIRRLATIEGQNYKELTESDFREILSSSSISLYVAEDIELNIIVGMVTLVVYRIPYVRKASMEDLVVDESYRGRGVGTKLIKEVLTQAKNRGASYLDFTSRPRRTAGNNIYVKLGFKIRDTNVYRWIYDYREV